MTDSTRKLLDDWVRNHAAEVRRAAVNCNNEIKRDNFALEVSAELDMRPVSWEDIEVSAARISIYADDRDE